MPVVTIKGMPNGTPNLETLLEITLDTVANVEKLELDRRHISVFFPTDLVQKKLGTEVICEVTGLYARPERTHEVLRALADALEDILRAFAQKYLPKCRNVEVLVYPFDIKVGAVSTSSF